MFKKSEASKEPDLFIGFAHQLNGRKHDDLVSKDSWQNVFFREVLSQVDESLFEPLFSNKVGRPNASIRILVGMIILKEGQDWTDQQLYENCRYNLKVMLALGLTNLDDEVPVPSTYYDFKTKLDRYYREEGKNLFSQVFKSITSSQIKKYQISGKCIRMDSKLIQSNIGTWTRLQKIIQSFQVFYKSLKEDRTEKIKKQTDRTFIAEIMSKPAGNHLYGMKNDEKEKWLKRLGFLIRKVLNVYESADSTYYDLLKQIYQEQYCETRSSVDDHDDQEDIPSPRPKAEMDPQSIQSIHDPEASYRIKGHGREQQKVSGFSSNITETVDEKINIITDVQVEKATYSDDKYLISSLEHTQQVTNQEVLEIHTDGGYDSHENRFQFGKWKNKKWHLNKLKGGREYLFRKLEDGSIQVYDGKEDTWITAQKSVSGKYRIRINGRKSKYRYFSEQQVESYLILQQVKVEDRNPGIRANMESTINQVFHTLNGNRSKYRQLIPHMIFVNARCLWVNCKRIQAWILENLHQWFNCFTTYYLTKFSHLFIYHLDVELQN